MTSMGTETFRGCTGLSSVTIPASVATIGESAFRGCSALSSVTMTGKDIDTVKGMTNYSWYLANGTKVYCTNGYITIGGDDTYYTTRTKYTAASGRDDWEGDIVGSLHGTLRLMWGTASATRTSQIATVISAVQVDVGTHVTEISQAAFASCNSLSSVVVPSTTAVESDAFFASSVMSLTMTGRTTTDVQNMSGWPLQTKSYSGGNIQSEKFSLPSGCVIHCTDGDITI